MSFLENLREQRKAEQEAEEAQMTRNREEGALRLQEEAIRVSREREIWGAYKAIRIAALRNSIVPQLAHELGALTGGVVDDQEDRIYIRYEDGFLRTWRDKTYKIGREIEIAGRDDGFINIGRKTLNPIQANDLDTVDKALEDAYKHRRKTKTIPPPSPVFDDWQ